MTPRNFIPGNRSNGMLMGQLLPENLFKKCLWLLVFWILNSSHKNYQNFWSLLTGTFSDPNFMLKSKPLPRQSTKFGSSDFSKFAFPDLWWISHRFVVVPLERERSVGLKKRIPPKKDAKTWLRDLKQKLCSHLPLTKDPGCFAWEISKLHLDDGSLS